MRGLSSKEPPQTFIRDLITNIVRIPADNDPMNCGSNG